MVLWLDYVESALRNTADSLRIFSNGQDEMVGWHHQLNGREFEQTPGDSDGQGGLDLHLHFMGSQRVGHY